MSNNVIYPWQNGGFGLYVHWPFCQSKCPYCDFNSHVVANIDQERWLQAYLREIRRLGEETEGRVLQSIFFGGGTPSLMPAKTVEAIILRAADIWRFANDIEITLEANPTSAEATRFKEFRSAGVNRLSIGVQALNDPDLRRLGRMHSAKEALIAIDLAQTNYTRVSFDLIYARQDQSISSWEGELSQALALGTEHLSLYQLTIEPETVFGERFQRGQLKGLPIDDLAADMYLATQALCDAAQMTAYEVSNHAQAGAESRHNMIYWRCGDYIGVGPGAHGRLTDRYGSRFATEAPKSPGEWLNQIETAGYGEVMPREQLSKYDQARESVIMGLRLTEGIEIEGAYQSPELGISKVAMAELQEGGLIHVEAGRIKPSLNGRLLLNALISKLAP